MIKKLIFLAVFVCVFCIHYEVDATKGTDVKGLLRTDTIWTKEGSPYNLVDNIQVGGKLTIEPGVTVIGNRKDIAVFGELEVSGSKDKKVRLMSVNLKGGDYLRNGKMTISNSDLFKCSFDIPYGIKNSFILKDSWIDDSFGQSFFTPQFNDYNGYFNDYNGYSYFFGDGAIIERNIFANILPISVSNNSKFINNVFLKNYKLNISGEQNIVFNYNSFLGEENDVVKLYGSSKINNIENNFWNTNIKSKISEKIYDADDDLRVHNTVSFDSYLSSPHENTPSMLPSKAPTLTSVYTQKSTSVKGFAEPGSLLNYFYYPTSPYEVGTEQGWIFVDSTGEFEINSIYSGDYTMRLTSIKNGITSEESNTVALDSTPPLSPNVDDVSDQTQEVTGSAEGGAKIIVKKGSEVLGMSDATLHPAVRYERYYLNYNVSISKQVAGTKLNVYAVDLAGNMSAVKEIVVSDKTPPLAPTVDKITDQTLTAKGKAEPGATVSFKSGIWIIGSGLVDREGNFDIPIVVPYAGDILSVSATDTSGNISEITKVLVKDGTAPSSPLINDLTEHSTTVIGWAEPNSTILITSGSSILGTATTSEYGMFEVIIAPQSANTIVTIVAVDAAGNRSKEIQEWVRDITPPEAPKVEVLTDQMTTVSGQTEATAEVTVKVGNKTLGTTQARADGNFTLTIPLQAAGVEVSVVATDQSGHMSEETIVTVKDVTAPEAPKVDVLTNQMTKVSGQAEANAKVTVKVDEKVFGTTSAGTDGIYSLTIPRQAAGVKVSVVATDLAGNTSEETLVIVKDVTAPEAPKVDALTDQMTKVSGQAEANAKVTVKVDEKVFGTTSVGTDGIYSLKIPRQAAGVKVSVIATDLSGNTSEETIIIVKDVTAPEAPKVDALTDQMTKVSGQAEANAKVTMKVDGKVFGTTSAGTDGIYSLTIPRQAAGVKVSVMATDAAGNTSAETTLLVKDVTSPPPPKVYEVTDKAISVSGTAEAGSKILVKIGIKEVGNSIVNSDGTYKIQIAKQKAGVKLTVVAIDHYENISKSTEMIVKDTTPPLISSVGLVSDQSIVVSGKVESNVKVYVKVGSKLIGSALSGKGIYNIKIVKQKAGTKLTVYAVDASGNQSKSKQVTVLDRTPPATPIVNKITNTSKMISGKAESNAKVFVYYNSKKIAEGNADSKGNFKVKIKAQKKGSVLKVYAQDKSSNRSKEKTLKVI